MKALIESLPQLWKDAIWASLTGDAFGVPHEGKRGDLIPPAAALEMIMAPTYDKSYDAVPYGTWSDDGAQLLALLDALMNSDLSVSSDFEARFSENLIAWYFKGCYQVDEHVFDCGGQTRSAILELAQGRRPTPSDRCGNGSLMRVLPVAAMPDAGRCDQDTAIRIAMIQSDLTHPNPIARVVCALHVELCWLLQEASRADERVKLYALALEAAARLGDRGDRGLLDEEEVLALEAILRYGTQNMPSNGGFAPNMFWSALWAVNRSASLSETLRRAVGAGGDTDTAACIGAGLGAIVFPAPWDEKMLAWKNELRLPREAWHAKPPSKRSAYST